MFEKEEEFSIPLSDCLKVGMVSYNIQSIQLSANIEEKIYKETKKRLEFIYATNIKDLYKHQEQEKEKEEKSKEKEEEQVNGLLSKKWMQNVMNLVPSILVIHYHIKIGANKELEEKNIFQILEDIRKYSATCIIIFIVISKDMQENPYTFNYDDKTKPYCLKKYMNKNDFYIFQIEEIWKTNEFKSIYTKIYLNSREFYGKYKKKYKDKREKTKIREERIEYDIKLGVLSLMKSKANKKNKPKYFNEAYELLCDKNFDIAKYKYGSKPVNAKYNFCEIRSVADWLFFKSPIIKNALFHELIKIYKKHISCFNNIKFYDKGKKDFFHYVEYYWLFKRYKNLSDSIEIIINNGKVKNKNNLITFGMILFKQVYFLIKMIKFYEINFNDTTFDLSSILIDGKKIEIKDIEEESCTFFGKSPIFYIFDKENSNNKKYIDINLKDEIYIKKFIVNKKVGINDIIDMLKNNYFNKIISFFQKLNYNDSKKNTINNSDDMQGIKLYIDILKILSLNNSDKNGKLLENQDISETILNIYKIISNSPQIKKFTKVYANFLKQFISLIQFKIKEEKEKNSPDNKINYYKTELLMKLSVLGNIRKLEPDEENLFFDIFNDTQFIPVNQDEKEKNIFINLNYYNKENSGIINCNNLTFNFDYSIKDIENYKERKMLDLAEYQIKFNSSLSKEKIKLNSLKLYLKYINEDSKKKSNKNTEIIIKEYNKEELDKYELGLDSNILIIYKLLLKKKKGKLYLNKVIFTLCKKENIYYSIDIPSELDKTILLTGKIINVLNFKFPKKLINVGINQLFTFNYEIKKQQVKNMKIKDYKMIFERKEDNKDNNNNENNNDNNNDNNNGNKQLLKRDLKHNIDDYIDLNNDDNQLKKKVPGSFHNPNNQINQNEYSLIQFMLKNPNERHLSFHKNKFVNDPPIPHLFYAFDEKNNCIQEYKNYYETEYNNFESNLENGERKFSVLFKFSEYGLYKIKLTIKFSILHEEIGDIMEFNKENIFYFKVINPLKLTNKITSENYILFTKNKKNKQPEVIKEYLTDSNIKINLICNNILEEGIIIKDIKIIPNEILSNQNRLQIKSTLKEIIDNKNIEESIKEEILKIYKYSNYSLPFELEFYRPFFGSLGKCQIIWTTNSLKEFQKDKNMNQDLNLFNINEYDFPIINVNLIELKYNYEKNIKDNQIILNLKIHNRFNFNKNLIIKIENNDDIGYIISGSLKQKVYLKANEMIKFSLKLIVMQKGEIKLPRILIKELDINGKELLTNYICPDNIIFNN